MLLNPLASSCPTPRYLYCMNCPHAQAWVRQYKLDFDTIQAEYLNEFDVRALPTPTEFVKFLKQVWMVCTVGG